MEKIPRTLDETFEFAVELNGQDLTDAEDKLRSSVDQTVSWYALNLGMGQDLKVERLPYSSELGKDLADRSSGSFWGQIADRWRSLFGKSTNLMRDRTDANVEFYKELTNRYREASGDVEGALQQNQGKDDGAWWKSLVWMANKTIELSASFGVDTRFTSFRGLVTELGMAQVRNREDKAGLYRAMGAGMGFAIYEEMDMGVEASLQGYLKNVRELRYKWPSMIDSLDTVIRSLQRNLPNSGMSDMFTVLDDVRRYAFFTGQSMDRVAERAGGIAREFDRSGTEAIQDMLYINDLARSFMETTGVNIDLEKFRDYTVNLGRLAIPFGVTLREAADMTSRYAMSLNEGTLSIQDLVLLVTGYTKGGPARMEYMSALMLQNLNPEGEFKEIIDLLRPYADQPHTMSRLLETLATRSPEGYNEFGLAGKFKDAERIHNLLNRALMETVDVEITRIGGTKAEQQMWKEKVLTGLGMLNADRTPDEKRILIGGGDIEVRKLRRRKAEDAANRYSGNMGGWREFVDENQRLSEDVSEMLNKYMEKVFSQVVDWRQWMYMTFPYLGRPADIANQGYTTFLGSAYAQRTIEALGLDVPQTLIPPPTAPPSAAGTPSMDMVPDYQDQTRYDDPTIYERTKGAIEWGRTTILDLRKRFSNEREESIEENEIKGALRQKAGVP